MTALPDEEAARARDALFAGIAHDLRNPLNTFAMSTGLLKDDIENGDVDTTRALSLIKRMERASQRMQALIDDLVTASRLESQKASLARKEEDVGEIIREAVAAATPMVKERGAELAEGPVDAGLHASVDRVRVVLAIVKATSFVLRTTGEHGRVTIGAAKCDDGIAIVVRGVNPGGVPASAPGREEGRGGLALLITRGHVTAHGGSVDVRYDDGTTVTIVLP
jgi:signal transduction histidine kinase